MTKKIVLITGHNEPKRQARVAALYADAPEDRRVIRTPLDLQRALGADHTALIETIPPVLPFRKRSLATKHPGVEIEVVDADV